MQVSLSIKNGRVQAIAKLLLELVCKFFNVEPLTMASIVKTHNYNL